MNRRTESPMDWEYQDSGPVDPNSPFTWQPQKNEKNALRPNSFAFGTSFRNPSFAFSRRRPFDEGPLSKIASDDRSLELTTPTPNPSFTLPRRRPLDEDALSEVASDDETPELTKREPTWSNHAAGVKKKPRSRARSPSHYSRNPTSSARRRKRASKPFRGSSDFDKNPYFSESSSSGSIDISDSQRPGNRTPREAKSLIFTQDALRGSRESGWTPLALSTLVILTAICVGGTFYYRVLSISILVVWIYQTLIFSANYVFSSSKRPSRRPGKSFYTWILDFARLVGLLVLILWCLIISPIHIFIPTPMDAWTRYAEHPTFRSFEVLNDPGRSTIVEVFAIHGLGSNPSSAWRYGGNGSQVYWLTDLLPKQKGLENIKIIMLNHQTRWDSHSPEVDFDVFAKMMLDDIERLHQKNRPIIFIAHSFGGLLLKKVNWFFPISVLTLNILATTRSKHIPQMTKGIYFLGVPHHGTKASFPASLLACTAYWRGSSTTMLEYMSESNPAIAALDKEFYEAYARSSQIREYNAPYVCNFLEMRPERLGRLSLNPTVNKESGTLHYAEDVLLNTDHRGLNKFQSPNDPNFEKFLRHFYHALR
ncbi:Ff.00g015930.m01.CDS01 [Fusarium sp. VM40]|nr:Ff.00g015930.m01.CDS01 [Fusarium sp. VM40]